MSIDPTTPTRHTYKAMDVAYKHFNAHLFSDELPNCLMTLQRKSNAAGFYCFRRFASRKGNDRLDEIALNPEHFLDRSIEDIMSTLVHEMCHLWQYHNGEPTPGYHDKEWSKKMQSVGLMPSHNGEPGGKRTGRSMTHYVIKGGKFARAFDQLMSLGIDLKYGDMTYNAVNAVSIGGVEGKMLAKKAKAAEASKRSKTKYSCHDCGLNAWARPDANIWCGDCEKDMKEEM